MIPEIPDVRRESEYEDSIWPLRSGVESEQHYVAIAEAVRASAGLGNNVEMCVDPRGVTVAPETIGIDNHVDSDNNDVNSDSKYVGEKHESSNSDDDTDNDNLPGLQVRDASDSSNRKSDDKPEPLEEQLGRGHRVSILKGPQLTVSTCKGRSQHHDE